MNLPNPDYQPAPYEVSYAFWIRTKRQGVKPSKYKRRLRYLGLRYTPRMVNEFNYYFPDVKEALDIHYKHSST
jgi:hypothetical protein